MFKNNIYQWGGQNTLFDLHNSSNCTDTESNNSSDCLNYSQLGFPQLIKKKIVLYLTPDQTNVIKKKEKRLSPY